MQKQEAVAIQSDEIRRRRLRQDASPFILNTSVRQSLDKSEAGNLSYVGKWVKRRPNR